MIENLERIGEIGIAAWLRDMEQKTRSGEYRVDPRRRFERLRVSKFRRGRKKAGRKTSGRDS
jgi:hypothetical protein